MGFWIIGTTHLSHQATDTMTTDPVDEPHARKSADHTAIPDRQPADHDPSAADGQTPPVPRRLGVSTRPGGLDPTPDPLRGVAHPIEIAAAAFPSQPEGVFYPHDNVNKISGRTGPESAGGLHFLAERRLLPK